MRRDNLVETKTASFTLTEEDSGKTFIIAAVDLVATLPSTVAGLRYEFYVKSPSGGTGFSVSPAAADAIHYATSVDNKDLINSGATDVEGDSVTVVGDGAEGWWVPAITGTWAKEA